MSDSQHSLKTTPPATRKSGRLNVIKQQDVVLKSPIMLNPAVEGENGTLEVIREGNLVVGVRYHCCCGRTAEIYFDYETKP